MTRILAVDYGGKRCGLAWTDPLQISVNPLETVSTLIFENKLSELIMTGELSDVVFGLSSHADGNLTPIGIKVEKLLNKLTKQYQDINFHTIDEAFTSRRAKELMLALGTKKKKRSQKESVDQMSAVLILRDFLDSI